MKKLNAWLSDWRWWVHELINARPWLFFIVNFVLLLIVTGLLDSLITRRKDRLWVAVPLLVAGELLFSIVVFIIVRKLNQNDKRTVRKRGLRTRRK